MRLRRKLPDLEQSLELVKVLEEKGAAGEETATRFVLSDQAYATALIPPSQSVCLWLGVPSSASLPRLPSQAPIALSRPM